MTNFAVNKYGKIHLPCCTLSWVNDSTIWIVCCRNCINFGISVWFDFIYTHWWKHSSGTTDCCTPGRGCPSNGSCFHKKSLHMGPKMWIPFSLKKRKKNGSSVGAKIFWGLCSELPKILKMVFFFVFCFWFW